MSMLQRNIRRSLQPLLDDGRAILEWGLGSTSDLVDRLRKPPTGASSWHVFHFCGHGGFNPQTNKGYIVVDPDPVVDFDATPTRPDLTRDSVASLDSDDLKDALEWADGLRLVVLNSCRGAMGNVGAASAAEELVTKGFAAVIAMQFQLSDRAGIVLSTLLYQALAQGEPIQRAVTLARQYMKRNGMPEWITPVLYMRTSDGRLFRY
jgi:CHAT domain-containing protein